VSLGRHLGALIHTYFSQAATLPEDREVAPQGTAGALRGIPDLDGSRQRHRLPGEGVAELRHQDGHLRLRAPRARPAPS
jgi:hypothetical protein